MRIFGYVESARYLERKFQARRSGLKHPRERHNTSALKTVLRRILALFCNI